MKFEIEKEVFKKFQELNVGIVIAKNIDNRGEDKEIDELLAEVEEIIKDNFNPDNIATHSLVSPWRAAYLAFGAKPKKYYCSVESLIRGIIDKGGIRRINRLVDLYNYTSLKYIVPIGSDDLNEVIGDIKLKIADGNEQFIPVGNEEKSNAKKGEIIYIDDVEVLCRRWNWRECYKTRITEGTRNAILYVEGLPPITKEELEKIIKDLADSVNGFLSGETTAFILNKENSEIEFKI